MSDIDRRRYRYEREELYRVDDDKEAEFGTFYYHESAVRELVEALCNYAGHDSRCVAGEWRQGRSNADGGYEKLFGYGKQEKWYQRGETPPCTCGLDEIFAHYKDLPGE